jgi:hypothetical protein
MSLLRTPKSVQVAKRSAGRPYGQEAENFAWCSRLTVTGRLPPWCVEPVRRPRGVLRVFALCLAQEARKAQVASATIDGHEGLPGLAAGALTGLKVRRREILLNATQFLVTSWAAKLTITPVDPKFRPVLCRQASPRGDPPLDRAPLRLVGRVVRASEATSSVG